MTQIYIVPTTGEAFNLDNEKELYDAWHYLKNIERDAKELKSMINDILVEKCGENEEIWLKTGRKIVKTTRTTTNYPMSVLKKFFDEDQISECVKPVKKNVENLAKELLDKDDRKDLLNSIVPISTSVTYKMI